MNFKGEYEFSFIYQEVIMYYCCVQVSFHDFIINLNFQELYNSTILNHITNAPYMSKSMHANFVLKNLICLV